MTTRSHAAGLSGLAMVLTAALAGGAIAAPAASGSPQSSPVRVMILDGESAGSYHQWELVTRVLNMELEETGLFDIDIVTAPPAGDDFSDFNPEFGNYDVVVMNYDAPDGRWPSRLEQSFESYMSAGGGLVVVHGADNAFPGWEAFNEMIGIGGWRNRNERSGPLWYYEGGELVSDTSPGRAGSHGRRTPFRIEHRTDHPITQGLPDTWMHQGDELYAALRGPGNNMTVLATAWSDPANNGTGHDEPMLMTLTYGDGRIFHTTLGHDVNALSSVGFLVTFQRGTEWAATGLVTQEVPANFPTADVVSYRSDIAAIDPRFDNGLNPLDSAPVR